MFVTFCSAKDTPPPAPKATVPAANTGPVPFTTSEIDKLVQSLRNAALNSSRKRKQPDISVDPPTDQKSESTAAQPSNPLPHQAEDVDSLDWPALRRLVEESAHRPHKNWPETDAAAASLARLIGSPGSALFESMFYRVLHDGNWFPAAQHARAVAADGATAAAAATTKSKPWVVLVTGLNGIRKTTSVYQPWFPQVLKQALYKSTANGMNTAEDIAEAALPSGTTSFFRQLDYMIATVANEDFRELYTIRDLKEYSSRKDKIFVRYRTMAEMLGILLIRAAQAEGMNIMIETSGRDIAMFNYIDYLFPDSTSASSASASAGSGYNKLVIHFTVNELTHAEKSVDTRMAREMANGQKALQENLPTRAIIDVNLGGPYGSEVLRAVQTDSDAVWQKVSDGSAGVGGSWYKANICINASSDPALWSAQAVSPSTNEPIGEAHPFVPI